MRSFKLVDEDLNNYEMATLCVFNELNGDLPISMLREFAERLVKIIDGGVHGMVE